MHIEEVALATASKKNTRLFYSKTLELPILAETDDTITFQAGNTKLKFYAVTDIKPYYHIAFNITNNKFSDSFEWINAKLDILYPDGQLPILVYPEWNAQSFYFYDNNGSILEFITRFDLPYYSADEFSVADIKEVSEVGIVASNVSAAAETLHSKFNIPYFSRSKRTENFTAMGNDNGLLIIIPRGHHWVPTNKPAQFFPMEITADGNKLEIMAEHEQ
jgi:catechol-2,3-dioxygenase